MSVINVRNEELEKMKRDAPLSEASMYAEFHRISASKENIVRTICGFSKVMNYEQQNLLYMNGFVLLIY